MAPVSADVFVPWMRTLLAVVLVSLSALAAAMAYPRWRRVQHALRSSDPLPAPALAPVFGYGVAAVAVLALILILLSR
jgi:putative membrane protein